ncbi:MAG TPA: cytochrome c3 family protein [Bacteroidota bacterium]|nr:cytochrome c3 family protein [Bacteroidota bacterium]
MKMRVWIGPMLVALSLSLCSAAPAVAGDECIKCHQALGMSLPASFRSDVHFAARISCSGCHGGDSSTDDMAKAMDTSAGFVGVSKGDAASKMCARCHSDAERMRSYGSTLPVQQWEDLQASVHGKLSGSGGGNAVSCVTCHGAHGIVRPDNPSSPVSPLNVVKKCSSCHANAAYMRMFNPSLAVDQLDIYRTSVHGVRNAKGDLKAAQCVSCHGSHGILRAADAKSQVNPVNLPATCATCHSDASYMKGYGIPTDQYDKFSRSVHGVALLQKHDASAPACNRCHGNHGAAPPGVASISNVCGTCHALNAELFAGSPHKKAFDEQGLPECETCHGNHEIVTAGTWMLGVSDQSVCGNCHSADANASGFAVARMMRSLADSLLEMESAAEKLVDEAEQKGMEITEARFGLRDVRQARLQSRTVVHAFDEPKFRAVVEKGITQAASVSDGASEAIDEFYFRRIGLGVSTLIITILALSLWLLIRRIETKAK